METDIALSSLFSFMHTHKNFRPLSQLPHYSFFEAPIGPNSKIPHALSSACSRLLGPIRPSDEPLGFMCLEVLVLAREMLVWTLYKICKDDELEFRDALNVSVSEERIHSRL